MRTLKFSIRFRAFLVCQLEYLAGPILLAAYFLTGIVPFIAVTVLFSEYMALQLYSDWRNRAIFAEKILEAIRGAEKDESAQ